MYFYSDKLRTLSFHSPRWSKTILLIDYLAALMPPLLLCSAVAVLSDPSYYLILSDYICLSTLQAKLYCVLLIICTDCIIFFSDFYFSSIFRYFPHSPSPVWTALDEVLVQTRVTLGLARAARVNEETRARVKWHDQLCLSPGHSPQPPWTWPRTSWSSPSVSSSPSSPTSLGSTGAANTQSRSQPGSTSGASSPAPPWPGPSPWRLRW